MERGSSCRAYAHLRDITTSTSFQRISGMLKSRILRHANLHPTAMLNLLCRANPTLCPPICLCFIGILRFGKRLLGMPMSLAALTLEKNWIVKGVRCTMPGVETCSIIIPERFHIVLVLPESCFAPEYVAYRLRGCSQPSFPLRKAVQKSTSVVGLLRTSSKQILESWHSQ